MADDFILEHLPFILLPSYFILYTILRVSKHWSDGKEPAQTSTKRFATKLFLTISLSILDLIHIADYSPGQNYSTSDMVFRVAFYILSALSWLFSAGLVVFDYYRRLKSQWRGQRIFWIFEMFSYMTIITLNAAEGAYDFAGTEFYRFYLIQIVCHALSVLFCMVLTYFSVFRPNDFTVINRGDYPGFVHGNSTDESIREVDGACFRVRYTGYKSKEKGSCVVTHYKFSVTVNEAVHVISKTFQQFEALDKALRGASYTFEEPLPEFNYSKLLALSVQERSKELEKYLNLLRSVDFMTIDLLKFLKIEGTLKETLMNRHMDIHAQKFRPDFNTRSESISLDYFGSRLDPGAVDSIFTNSTSLQWLVEVKIFRPSPEISKDVDFCLECKIPKLCFEKILGVKLQDFSNLHKTLSKIYSPASLYFINKSFPNSLKQKDDIILNQIQIELEHYMLEVLNDPAFLCKEALDFIKCDADVSQILDTLPEIQYKITDHASWENTISEDASHITLYRLRICQRNLKEASEKEWQFLRRYREFDSLHRRILARQGSSLLRGYAARVKVADGGVPNLPGKSIAPLSSSSDIEERKVGLVNYMKELCENPLVSCSYAFREFVDSVAN